MDKRAERIELIMKHYSMNKEEFAEKIGIQASTLKYILIGRDNVTLGVIDRFCMTYPEINVGWLLFGRGDMIDYNRELNPLRIVGFSG